MQLLGGDPPICHPLQEQGAGICSQPLLPGPARRGVAGAGIPPGTSSSQFPGQAGDGEAHIACGGHRWTRATAGTARHTPGTSLLTRGRLNSDPLSRPGRSGAWDSDPRPGRALVGGSSPPALLPVRGSSVSPSRVGAGALVPLERKLMIHERCLVRCSALALVTSSSRHVPLGRISPEQARPLCGFRLWDDSP